MAPHTAEKKEKKKSSSLPVIYQEYLSVGSAQDKLQVTQATWSILVVSLCDNDHFQSTSSSSFVSL